MLDFLTPYIALALRSGRGGGSIENSTLNRLWRGVGVELTDQSSTEIN
jgi:hypothetical protein